MDIGISILVTDNIFPHSPLYSVTGPRMTGINSPNPLLIPVQPTVMINTISFIIRAMIQSQYKDIYENCKL